MDTFNYQARNRAGKILSGTQNAVSKKAVADSLIAKDLTPISIESTTHGKPLKKALGFLPSKRVPLKARVLFARQFATMISAGVPIVRALTIMSEQAENITFKVALSHIAKEVEAGSTLAAALEKYPKIFSHIFVAMVHAGEVGGMLDEVLEHLADQMEKDAEIVSKVRGAMVYPGLIFTVMIFAVIFIMTVVVPQLATVFKQMDAELPWNTKLLISIADFMTGYGIYIIGAIGIIGFSLFRIIKTNLKARRLFHIFLLRIPVLGMTIRKMSLARFARTLGSMLGAGIPVLQALQVVADSINNIVLKSEITRASTAVKNGASLARTLHTSKEFPSIVSEMIAVGEETGELEKILLKLADFYDKEITAIVTNIATIIEPFMLILMGLMVGTIIVSVIGPLYQLTSAF
ncbi:type II secretion system F family protein [Candidatus Saccharibacteria bacterium]|nr:type II secretion system F family protein [Candidatus Saccharibacteria bacterium]